MEETQIAVIGYGGQGGWHCEQLLQSDACRLAGIYDIDESRRSLAESRGIKAYSSREELLADKNVTAVTVATPNDTHIEIVKAALKAGKHVICEKPVALNAGEFEEMVNAAKDAKRILTVHQNRRFDVDFLAMKSIIESGEIGEPINIESRVHGSRGIPSDWRTQKEHGGGMIYDWGVHLIDQILQVLKTKIVSVYCVCSHITTDEVDDGFRLILRFSDGRTAHIEVGTYNFLPMPRFYLQCKNGTAVVTDWKNPAHVAKMKAWNEKEVVPVQTAAGITKTMAPRDEITLDEYDLPYFHSDVHDFYRNFVSAIKGGSEPMVTTDEVMRVMRVMEAALLSDETKKAIKTDIGNGKNQIRNDRHERDHGKIQ